jgi:hypothetical protein
MRKMFRGKRFGSNCRRNAGVDDSERRRARDDANLNAM